MRLIRFEIATKTSKNDTCRWHRHLHRSRLRMVVCSSGCDGQPRASFAPLGLGICVAIGTRGLRRLATDLRPCRGEPAARAGAVDQWSSRSVEQLISREDNESRYEREGGQGFAWSSQFDHRDPTLRCAKNGAPYATDLRPCRGEAPSSLRRGMGCRIDGG